MKHIIIKDRLGNSGIITEKGSVDLWHSSGNPHKLIVYMIKKDKPLAVPVRKEVKPNNNGHDTKEDIDDSEIAKMIKPYVRGMYNGV